METQKYDDYGWISLHRKLLTNKIFSNSDGLKVWIWCLLRASRVDKTVLLGRKNIELKTGQFIFGRATASEFLRMPGSTVVFWINFLKLDSYLDIKTTNKYSIITVLNFDQYQNVDSNVVSRKTTERQQKDTNNTYNTYNKVLPKGNTVKDQYGSPHINFILEEFKKNVGIYPIDSNKRNIAQNIYQITKTFNKKYGSLYKEKRGTDIKFSDIIRKAWEVYRKNNGDHLPQRIKTFKEHYKGMLEQLSISLTSE